MLRSLTIRDYALIEHLELRLEPGLNILTGETGAGKSILVGALKLILGERASTESVRSGARKAIVEGEFEAYDEGAIGPLLDGSGIERQPTLILRREVSESQGRVFINDTPATVQVLRAVAEHLVDLHGQHEHQSLLREATHGGMLDAVGGLGALVASYREVFARVRALVEERRDLSARERELARQKELWGFQVDEIDAVRPEADEEERLEAERRILENAERLHQATAALFDLLYESDGAVYDRLTIARNELAELVRIDPSFAEAAAEIRQGQIAVGEIAKHLQDYNARIEFNPERLEAVRDRLGAIDRLKRRYGGTLEAVIAYRAEIGAQHALASDFEGALRRLDARLESERAELSRAAALLSAKRHETAVRIASAIEAELAGLGMASCRFVVRFDVEEHADGWVTAPDGRRVQAFPAGMDKVAFHLSTNPGEEPRPLSRIASGGEVSRVMLALKSILAKSDRLPILVFDEIDVGVSGAVAQRVGERMKDLSAFHQIVAITHLPQVAALADAHFRVEKVVSDGRTRSAVRRLGEAERVDEVASLMSGAVVSESARASARELIESGR